MRRPEKSRSGWYFLAIVVLLYGFFAVINVDFLFSALKFAAGILASIVPLLFIVYILLFISDYYLKPARVIKYLGRGSGWKGWLFSILGGILSTGPIYMWYPLMNELQQKGMRNAFIACFLHNRAIKPALLPVFIHYFGITYVLILTCTTVVFSVFQGFIVENFAEVKK